MQRRLRGNFDVDVIHVSALAQSQTAAIQSDRISHARAFAERHGVVVVLKGAGTIIAQPDGTVFVNTFSGLPERVYIGTKQSYPSSNPASYAWGLDEWLLSKQKEGDSDHLQVKLWDSAWQFEQNVIQAFLVNSNTC